MCPSLIEIGSKTAEKNSAQTKKQTDKQTDRQYDNGHLAVNQQTTKYSQMKDYKHQHHTSPEDDSVV